MSDRWKKGLIASVHIARAEMGLDDETYRGLLASVTGRDSCARCSVPQLKAVLAEFRARGWTPRPRQTKGASIAPELRPRHRKILALCLSQGRDLDYAEAVIRRMSRGRDSLSTASAARLDACIAALARQAGRTKEEPR